MQPKSILITDSYPLNSGDLAIVLSMVDEFRFRYPDVHIIIESSHPLVLRLFLSDSKCDVIPRIFNIERLFQNTFRSIGFYEPAGLLMRVKIFTAGIYDSFTFFFWACMCSIGLDKNWYIRSERREQATMIKSCDFVVSNGGSFLSTHYHYEHRVYFYLIALLLRKPLVLFAQSIGPFNSFVSKISIPYIMKKARCVTVREPYSFAYVQSYLRLPHIKLTADIAYMLREDTSFELPFESEEYITICVKRPKTGASRENYRTAMLRAVAYAVQHNLSVCLTSHTTADDEYCRELFELAKDVSSVNRVKCYLFGLHPKKLKHIYTHSCLLISARMHAIILASSGGVPFIALSYEEKFQGMVEQLGLFIHKENILFDLENISPDDIYESLNNVYMYRKKYVSLIHDGYQKMDKQNKLNIECLDACMS